MFFTRIILANLFLIAAEQIPDAGYCEIGDKSCSTNRNFDDEKLLFYDVNPPEGFNLRRDVYMRFAILLAEAQKGGKRLDWRLVLPPWYQLYHWRSQASRSQPMPWNAFFDVDSLKNYAPVLELYEVFSKTYLKTGQRLEIDTLYVLQNYPDPFEGGTFVDKWEEGGDICEYEGQFWGYKNITAKETVCVKFQGRISMLWELVSLHPESSKIMFAHAEIPLHDSYGTKPYWDCRKSMRFSTELVKIAKEFMERHLDCNTEKCSNYFALHWRRQDFARSRSKDVPSLEGTAKQVHEAIKKNTPNVTKIFVSTDASESEKEKLESLLQKVGYNIFFFKPSKRDLDLHKDGGVAIIDQVICSHGAFFIGTHESTFSFRIQEEREILGFDSGTTFNRLCPDRGKCEKVSKWTIVN